MQRRKIQLAELSNCPTRTSEISSSAEIIEVWKYNCLNIEQRAGSHKHRDLRNFYNNWDDSIYLQLWLFRTNDRVLTANANI